MTKKGVKSIDFRGNSSQKLIFCPPREFLNVSFQCLKPGYGPMIYEAPIQNSETKILKHDSVVLEVTSFSVIIFIPGVVC